MQKISNISCKNSLFAFFHRMNEIARCLLWIKDANFFQFSYSRLDESKRVLEALQAWVRELTTTASQSATNTTQLTSNQHQQSHDPITNKHVCIHVNSCEKITKKMKWSYHFVSLKNIVLCFKFTFRHYDFYTDIKLKVYTDIAADKIPNPAHIYS